MFYVNLDSRVLEAMHFQLLPLAVSLLFSAATATTATSAAPLINGIRGINTAVVSLTSALKAYNGGINEASKSTTGILAVHAANRAAFAAAQALNGTLSAADSKKVVDYTRDTVGKTIPISIAVTKRKKADFEAALLGSVVESTLQLLMYDHDSYSTAVGGHLDPSSAAEGLAVAGAIAASIQSAIDDYAT